MKALTLSGKILYAVPFAIFGLGHLASGDSMAAMVPSFVPGGVFWVYFTGVAMLAAAASILIDKYTKLSGILLAALLIIFVVTVFAPGMASDNEQVKQMSFIGLMKDLSLAGAALLIAGIAENRKQ